MLESLLSYPDFWKYVSIPFIAGAVGWITNWMAVQMTFYPLEFIGIRPFFGWQGIIPSKVEKMAGIVVDKALSKLGSLDEFFREMEPEKISAHLTRTIQSRIEEYTDEVMSERNAVLWENLPLLVRKRVYSRARRAIPAVMDNVVDDISRNLDSLVDMKHMVTTQMSEDKALMVQMFREVGDPEFRFITNSGFYFGFLFGPDPGAGIHSHARELGAAAVRLHRRYCHQLAGIEPDLPAIEPGQGRGRSAFRACSSNVRKMWRNPLPACPRKRVITLRNIMYQVINGPRGDRTKALIKRHLKPLLNGGVVRTAAQLTVGPEGYADLKKAVEEKAVDLAVEPFEDQGFNRERGGHRRKDHV